MVYASVQPGTQSANLADQPPAAVDNARRGSKQWYRDPATLIAAAAFIVSFGTTVESVFRSNKQEVHGLRVELRSMLERLIVLPRENAEVFIKYEANPNLAGQLSGYLNQENLILAQQADGLAKRLPKDQVSASDYSAIAQALLFSRSYQQAILDLKEAVKSAVLLDEKVTALRTLGYVEMNLGQIASGRAHLEQALEIFVEFPGFDDFTVRSTTMQTQVNWTGAELAAGNYNVAVEHMNAAEQAVAPLPPGPGKSLLEAQLKQSRASLAQSQQPNAGSQQPAKPSSLIPPSLSPGAASKL